jgi:hypothetical protein
VVVGVAIGKTMQIHVSVGATSLIALLDTRSTHSFIAEDATRADRAAHPVPPAPDGHRRQQRESTMPGRSSSSPAHRR